MYGEVRSQTETERSVIRREAGKWLRSKRETRGLSQRQLGEMLDLPYYTLVAQFEAGHGKIPQDKYGVLAEALGMDVREFVIELLAFYDPVTYSILFRQSEG